MAHAGDDTMVFEMVVDGEHLVVVSVPIAVGAADAPLTRAERAIAEDVAAGRSNAEIAQRRGRSVRTVANQLAALYRKLGVGSRSELVRALFDR